MESVTEQFQYVDSHEAIEFCDQHGAFGFTSSSGDAYSCYQNTNSFHEAYGEQLSYPSTLGGQALAPNTLGSYHELNSHKSSMIAHVVETPLTCSTGDSRDFYNSFQNTSFMSRNSALHLTQQHNAAIVQAQVQMSPTTKLLSVSHCPVNSGAMYLKTNSCSNTNVKQGLSSDSPSSRKFVLNDFMQRPRSSEIVKTYIYGAEKLPSPLGDLSGGKPSGLLSSFASEHIDDFATTDPDLSPESSLLFHSKGVPVTRQCDQQSEHVIDNTTAQNNERGVRSKSSAASCNMITWSSEFDMRQNNFGHDLWDDVTMPVGRNNCSNRSAGTSNCVSMMEMASISGTDKGLFSESGFQQLLDAINGDHVHKAPAHSSGAKYVHPISGSDLENQCSTSLCGPSVNRYQVPSVVLPPINGTSGLLLPYCNSEVIHGSPKHEVSNSNICSWIDDSCSMNTEGSVLDQTKKPEEAAKVVKKRARPGESTRPRPKDRQQIQDRLKELRELVPNGAKCSIDALLDKTIKHMLFLQSVTKYADKLKQADEPKIIGEESGVVLKDNSGGVGGGATWAYEVAGQTMVCPIIVEDLTPPGQMLVEMLCEDRGLFLEIADIIRGFGLIILKGVMEIRERKIWARFLVEANREVTRMDIFLSLIQLLQQNSCLRSGDLANKIIDKGPPLFSGYHQSPIVSSS
ncbi:transcription factor LHW-like isoform X3 [Musa acuminata AAA Group]|uniref:transcription factor LHW-like isoform X3 n=1 Tax=Musa acuminata AAA Group TaxID=214697 RepID=UPI0031CE46DA